MVPFLVLKIFLAEVYQFLEFHVAHYADNHAVRGVVALHELFEDFGGEAAHVFLAAEDVVTERMVAEVAFLEVVVDEFGRGVAVEVDFFDDHVFLFLNLVEREGGVEEDVGKEFQTAFQMFGEGRGIDAGLLFGGEGVQFASYAVNAVADVVGVAVFGALEDGMLDEVGDALLGTLLVA